MLPLPINRGSSESGKGSSSKSKSLNRSSNHSLSNEQQAPVNVPAAHFSTEAQEGNEPFPLKHNVETSEVETAGPKGLHVSDSLKVAASGSIDQSQLVVSSRHSSSSPRHSPISLSLNSTQVASKNIPKNESSLQPHSESIPKPSINSSEQVHPSSEHTYPRQQESSQYTPRLSTGYNPRISTSSFPRQQATSSSQAQIQQSSHSSHSGPRVPSSSSPLPPTLIYSESDPDYQPVKSAAECLHAHDYSKMANILERATVYSTSIVRQRIGVL